MPKIINGYRAGAGAFANALARAADVLGGDQVTPAVRREQLYALQRENSETDALAEMFRNPGYDPRKAIASGIAAGKVGDVADAHLFSTATAPGTPLDRVDAARRGAKMPETSTFDHQNRERATRVDINNADNASAEAQNAARIAEQRRQFDNTPEPVLRDGKPAYAPRSGVYDPAIEPILSNTERQGTVTREFDPTREEQARILGADPGSSDDPQATYEKYYRLAIETGMTPEEAKQFALAQAAKRGDGISVTTDADGTVTTRIGGVPGLANKNIGEEQGKELAFSDWTATRDQAFAVATDPSNFGITGNVKYTVQQIGAIARNLKLMSGGQDVETAVQQMASEVADPGARATILKELSISDPALRALHSLRLLLAYQAAKANGSTGRDLSNQELQANLEAVGNPTGLLTSQDTFITALRTLDYNVRARRNARLKTLGIEGGDPLPPFDEFIAQPMPVPGAAPQNAAPPMPKPGDIVDNHRFKGGDPADPASWEPL